MLTISFFHLTGSFMSIAWVVAGLVLLAVSADIMIRGAAALGVRFGLSPLWIGIVLVGFGTSTPELLTSLRAAAVGAPGIAIGNVVGSNIANILLILGVAALIRPLVTAPAAFRRDMFTLLMATSLLTAAVVFGTIDRMIAAGFLFVFVIYLVVLYRAERSVTSAAGVVY
jgi:cation:H+ antiporter